ncbi:TLP18.3/Psb32/MOLO-1 phosphatase superfamily protein [Sinimarinibacterium flocculans]|uniref:TLP18.3/Psb32/MOLO-1 phosphatase superfamily protein n=2 Tax=Sinimarinibacterium flocculans TaxID=985250 RepID=A0A318EB51_9GAMM|nr:TLP18.3/Psb32/MOLO-1 phosphatase superfamily protein [Sinimarinibacterium flocculans]
MLWVWATTVVAAEPVSPNGSVVDMAGVLDVDTMLQLDSTLASYAAATGFTMAVVTVGDLAPDTLQDYARVSLQAYVAARSDPGARVALLMWSSTREVAVAVSPAFGRELAPEEVARVLREQVLPQVTADAVGAGMLHGVYGLMVAAGEASGEVGDPRELVMVARWGADAAAAVPNASPDEATPPEAYGGGDTLAQALRRDPAAAVAAAWRRAQGQWADLSVRVYGLLAEARASGATSPKVVPFVLAGVVLLAILVGAWQVARSPAAPAVLLGLAAAALCWGLTGYVELTVLLASSGFVVWAALALLRVLAARNHEARLPAGGYPGGAAAQPPRPPPPAAARQRMPAPAPAASRATATRIDTDGKPAPKFLAAIEHAHRKGQRTPALDHLIAQKGRPVPARFKQRRQYWLVAIAVCFFVAFPLVFVLLGVWALTELNRIKPPQQRLPDFLRQLRAELQLVSGQGRSRT